MGEIDKTIEKAIVDPNEDDVELLTTVPDGEVWYVERVEILSEGSGADDPQIGVGVVTGQISESETESILDSTNINNISGRNASVSVDFGSANNDSEPIGAYMSGNERIWYKVRFRGATGTAYLTVSIRRVV